MNALNLVSKIFLVPVTLVYGIAVGLRRKCYDRGLIAAYEAPVKTICVGNIAVGGTGKTPHVAYLVRLLRDNYRIAILSRGYKRRTRGFYLAGDDSTALDLGDEAMQQQIGRASCRERAAVPCNIGACEPA